LGSLDDSAAQTPPFEPESARSPGTADRGRQSSQGAGAERKRLTLALLFSLLFHALLLSLAFGADEFGLPGFGFFSRERRIEAPSLRVDLVPLQVAAAEPASTPVKRSAPQASVARLVASRPAQAASKPSAAAPRRTARAVVAVPANAPLPTERSGDAVPAPIPEAAVITAERSDEVALVAPAAPSVPEPVIPVVPSPPSPETVTPPPQEAAKVTQTPVETTDPEPAVAAPKLDLPEREAPRQPDRPTVARPENAQRDIERAEAARLEAERRENARQEAVRIEAARLEAERREAARLAAAQMEAQRQEAARQEVARRQAARLEAERREAARAEADRLEAERQETARLAAAQVEAQRREAVRLEAARAEAARLEVERREAARLAAAQLEAQRREAVRLEAARAEATRLAAEQEEDERREARRRAMGRQLDEEAARRDATARSQSMLPLSLSTARRVRLWGRADPNEELVKYAEALARKIQLNTPVDTVLEVKKRPHTDPMVTVALRSDGSVESIPFVLSSGVAEVDAAIRRIVQSHAPYQTFPPELARDYDVIEVRRTWYFDVAVRLY
jgi:hypothetical protein